MFNAATATWGIAGLATLGVVARPWNLPEFIWAVTGAVLLVAFDLLPWREALTAAGKGVDVYFFLVGMMLLAEVARKEGLFDWLAVQAVRQSRHSASRLFAIVYAVGTVVTIFLSNDATAVVLTPAVYAATRTAKVEPLPYLFVCAFIANAASFVLPISNPANLVVFGERMPTLIEWLRYFGLPSVVAIAATFLLLRFSQRDSLRGSVESEAKSVVLTRTAAIVALGIGATAVALLVASALGRDLGLPTFVCGAIVTAIALVLGRKSPLPVLRDVAWSVLPLVAGLFILVEGLNHTGVLPALADMLKQAAADAPKATAWGSGIISAFASNLINNLPMGLIAATTSHAAQASHEITAAILIGVDLGPNLSVTGSLATILWLIALRREGENVSAVRFLKLGLLVMPPSLVLSLFSLSLVAPR
ncbi:arsenic transporter [Bradyrhizobium viridifuturi]|uniref:arsenic transporter n=1 Tax=Bradyrhizobium viridifuturi TaxID=1654716 RepID=UPI00067F7091|nr:arsenic transporter [Bradyrhizobium viridifuturi]